MTSTARPAGFQHPQRDPNLAAMLSVIPGLGQMYNGEIRKGLLFVAVSWINFSIFLLILATTPIVKWLVSFGQSFHVRPNKELVTSILQLHLGSPASLVVIGLFLSFIAYAIRDAYDHAALLQRRHIYPEFVMEMPEATSGSYIFHCSLMWAAFILAFFFLIPPPPRTQVTDIEFIQNQPPTPKKIISPKRAQHNSEASGHHENKPVTAPSPAPKAPSKPAPEQKPQTQPQPKPTPVPTPTPHISPRPVPTPVAHPSPTPTPRPTPSPTPTPTPTPHPVAMPTPVPTPFAHPTATPSPNPSPSPAPMAIGHGSPTATPMPKVGAGGSHGSSPGPSPAPISTSSGSTGSGNPSPAPIAGGGSPHVGGGTGPSPAPAPTRAHGGGPNGGGGPALAVAPSVPRPQAGNGGEGVKGNPDANNNEKGRPSAAAQADVDFGPYMADLQRRIKRAWFPPKGNESKRVVVQFKIHKGGELSNLRIDHSSGLAIADQAALKAVENAAPFRPLPAGADDSVDIQFTFDYNVFAGGGHGVFSHF